MRSYSPSPLTYLCLIALAVAWVTSPLWTSTAQATSIGPQAGSTGVPAHEQMAAEMNCTACHLTSPINPDEKGSIQLEGLPDAYEAGKAYDLTFRIEHPDPQFLRWGFQLTAVRQDNYKRAGSLLATDPATTQVVEGGPGGRQYVEHSYGGTSIGVAGGASWVFQWVAPSDAKAPVAFFASGNAANVDGANTGDLIYSKSPEPLAVLAPRSASEAAQPDATAAMPEAEQASDAAQDAKE